MDFPHYTKTPEHVLKTVFGYDSFRHMQKNVIQNVLSGRDTLAVMPTGGGKSLCYEIPALIMNGLTVVVSPLIALMQDQVQQLESFGVPAVYLNSSLDWDTCKNYYDRIRRGEVKLLYVSPEGLNTERIRNLLHSQNVTVDCITIDEAHCISQWGHDFRPDYMEIANFRKEFPRAVCLALTATATRQVQNDIVANLKMDTPDILVASFNRPNILLNVERKTDALEQVLDFIGRHSGESGIIYCFSRRQVDEVAEKLQRKGLKVLNYHAGLSDAVRANNQKAFIQDKIDIMVATVAFGMGINKPDVRWVIHYDMPKSIEQYYQEIGRAGRDGLPSEALLLYSPGDIRKIRFFFNEASDPSKAEKLLQGMIRYAESQGCRRKSMLAYFGETYAPDPEKEDKSCCCDICWNEDSIPKPKAILIKAADRKVVQESGFKSFPKPTSTKKKAFAQKTGPCRENDPASKAIAEQLKKWRKKAADELHVPPYVIFGDKTMLDIAAKKPKTERELMNCYGIGENKAEKFGYYILRIVRES
ncbi:MAG: RecQ family ATP-dependent DNA helicase [Treponema sp.]|nr:RecQ family ATP-dependent DNA helicase [Treponema sp.]MCQ2240349.1 RecQ family ATP-dependent DNA helicase [Treponema sp.]